jgi:2-octaprenylphenol hydroxylase
MNQSHFLLKDLDIAIIGGGMVGASLALLLAEQKPDWQIALLEAQPFADVDQTQFQPSFDSRSTAIAQGSIEILCELGVWENLAKHATAISQVHVSDAGHFMGGLIDASTYDLDAVGYVIPNAWIGRVLLAQLRTKTNIHLFAPVRVEKLIPQQAGAQLVVKSGDDIFELTTKLAVVADGGDSPLRKSLGIDSNTKDYGQTALIANIAYSEAHKGVAYERFTPQGPLALLPLGESATAKESALVLTLPRDQAAEIVELNDEDFLQHLQTRFGNRLGKFTRVSQRHAYELKLVTASEQIRSHIVLVGNAAHFLHPVAGQGFNLSLRDCVCLVNALIQGEAAGKQIGELSVLQDYLDRQALDQALTIEFSDKLVRMFSSSSLPLIALRHLGFIGLDLLPAVKSQFAAQTMGTAGAKFL